MLATVITPVRLAREMVSTRKKVQTLSKHRDKGENAQRNKSDRIPT